MAVTRERVAEVLKDLRRLHGTADRLLSQEKAAQRADVNVRDWNRWENRRTEPTPASLGKVADAFEISLDTFDDGRVDHSQTPLSDRLDQIEEMLTELSETTSLEILPTLVDLRKDLEERVQAAQASARRRRAS